MKKAALIFSIIMFAVIAFGCDESKIAMKPKTEDPLEAMTYDYLNNVKAGNWDGAFGMMSEETRKYYPKEEYVAWAKDFILPKVDFVYVTKIEKRKLDAIVLTKFKPQTTWTTYNTLEQAKIKLEYIFRDGKWWIHMSDIVQKGREEEARREARLGRVAEWKSKLLISNFRVENRITDEGPMLVFNGDVENKGDKAVEMVMVKVDFFDGQGKKMYDVVVVPIYISEWEKKTALRSMKKTPFQQTISSEIPDTWTGEIKYELHDAGDMPQKQ